MTAGGSDQAYFAPPVTAHLDDTLRVYLRRRLQQHTHDRYAGLELQKFPEDLRVYEQLMWESRANVVIEVGTLYGASALWFRDRLRSLAGYERISAEWRVISVDIDHGVALECLDSADPSWRNHITLITGDVRDPRTIEGVREFVNPSDRCFVVEDSLHVGATTAAALQGFADLVPVGGFFVVEDGVVDIDELRFPDYPRGVLPALSAWLATPEGGCFERRRDLECYGVTCHPGGFLRRVSEHPTREVGAELRGELGSPPLWMYSWPLTPQIRAPGDTIRNAVHKTRTAMILPPLRQALLRAGAAASVIDLGCNEGWFSHLALSEGAARAVGVDVREVNIRRARLVRDHFSIPPDRLELLEASIFDLDCGALGEFDVVLILGLIYHLENPVGALRVARQLTAPGGIVLVETQLTRQVEPILHGWGSPDHLESEIAGFAARWEGTEDNPLASHGAVLSLIPNRAAVERLMPVAGFGRLEWLEPPADAESQYAVGDRGIVLGRPS